MGNNYPGGRGRMLRAAGILGTPAVVPGTAWPGGEQQRFKGSRVADIAAGRSRADSGWECRVYVSR